MLAAEPIVLAHMGGIDEIASVLVPLAGIIILLRAGAKKRAEEEAAREAEAAAGGSAEPGETQGDEPVSR